MDIDLRLYAPIATGIACIISSCLWFLAWNRKQLSYEIITQAPVATVDQAVQGRLQLTFDGRPVNDLQVIIVKIKNNGTVPIRAADFDGPLSVICGGGCEVLLAEVQETAPADLAYRSVKGAGTVPLIQNIEGDRAIVRPVLLNKMDFITLKVLACGADPQVSVSAHIEGIAGIKQVKASLKPALIAANAGVVLMALGLLFADFDQIVRDNWHEFLPNIVLFIAGYTLLMLGYMLIPRRHEAWHHMLGLPREVAMRGEP